MRAYKKVLLGVLIALFAWLGYYHQAVIYGVRQASGQLKLLFSTIPIEQVLADSTVAERDKDKIRLIQTIKQFTVDSIGLNPSKSYTTYFDQKEKPLIWMMTASDEFRLKAYQWSFPIVGTFSYKGYFIKSLAENELAELKNQGYDTRLGGVAAWSTLGYLKDPILSSMLKRNDGQLANLIIHELTHGTLYIKNNVEFNENLADFVGDYGAILFLKTKFGHNSESLKTYELEKQQDDAYNAHILRGTQKLASLYQTFEQNKLPIEQKRLLKKQLITEIIQTLDTNSVLKNLQPSKHWKELPNNAFFISFLNYRKEQNRFKQEFETKFNSNFKQYWAYLKQNYSSL